MKKKKKELRDHMTYSKCKREKKNVIARDG